MTIERARKTTVSKVWGVADPGPWQAADADGQLIGEVWFERESPTETPPQLLLKLLFAGQPLSIQVHPDDVAAHAIGLPHGKSEAWYVLRADPGSEVAVGLARTLSLTELRAAIVDETIVNELALRNVHAGDTIVVTGGTIHAIGAGVVVAEIQQRCDITFRLFDYGRGRKLDVESALAIAAAGPVPPNNEAQKNDAGMLAVTDHFVLERIELKVNSSCHIKAGRELWILVIGGSVAGDGIEAATGEALFAEGEVVDLVSGPTGAVLLTAYAPERDCVAGWGAFSAPGRRNDKEARGVQI